MALAALSVTAATLSGVSMTAQAAPAPSSGGDVVRQDETGKIGFIGTSLGKPIDAGFSAGAPAAKVADSFVMSRAKELGLNGSTTAVSEEHTTPGGGTAVRLAQVVRGVPVFGGEFVVNLDESNRVLSVLGEASPVDDVAITPKVAAGAAGDRAVAAVAKGEKLAAGSLAASAPALRWYDPRLLGAPGPFQTARLAWVTKVTAQQKGVTLVDETVVVDAATGSVALSFSNIHNARDRIVCDANNTPTEYPCVTPVWTETSQPMPADTDVQLAFEYAGDTYDFFATRFGRDSLDGQGFQLKSTVDFCPSLDPADCPYQNAFWDGSQMVYGDGFASADDVVGHELAHGFTDFSSELFYYYQSGAINESLSDVFGELIDQTNGSGTDTDAARWQLGEDIPGIGAIRNMADPTLFGDPDRMQSSLYTPDDGETDGGGVHTNSGVNNKAAFLMTDGGTFNGQTITGLGITKTARLYYTVNNSMLVSGSDYADLANALRQACTNLASTGTDGITAADCGQVEKVLLATEMDQNPLNAPTNQPELCPTGGAVDVYYDNLETPSGQFTRQDIVGPNGWYYPQTTNPYGPDVVTYTTSGVINIYGDDDAVLSDSALRMTNPVTIPAGAYLNFNHAFGFEDSDRAYDGGVVEYSTAGAEGPWQDAGPLFNSSGSGYNGVITGIADNPLAGRTAFVRESHGYGATRGDLSSLAGQIVMFRWRIGTDSFGADYGWFIDNIRINTCDAAAPETTITAGPKNGSFIKKRHPQFSFASSEPGSTFQCSVDGADFTACTSPLTTGRLDNGKHSFAVAALDTFGNADATPATRAFRVDKKAPKTWIARRPAPRKAQENTAYFRFVSSEKGATFKCKLDKGSFQKCKSKKSFTVKPGTHVLRVKSIDKAGNKDRTPAERKWRLRR